MLMTITVRGLTKTFVEFTSDPSSYHLLWCTAQFISKKYDCRLKTQTLFMKVYL